MYNSIIIRNYARGFLLSITSIMESSIRRKWFLRGVTLPQTLLYIYIIGNHERKPLQKSLSLLCLAPRYYTGVSTMPKRLGYKTDHKMINIRREWNEKLSQENLNASEIINTLLQKYWEREVCPVCLGGVIHPGNCAKCNAPYVICDNPGTKCQDKCFPFCGENRDCTWDELYGVA